MSRQLVITIDLGLSLEGVSAMGVVDELEKLADLFHKKVISEQEFQELKEQLISRGSQRTEDTRAGAGLVRTPEQMKKAQAGKQVSLEHRLNDGPLFGRGGLGGRRGAPRATPSSSRVASGRGGLGGRRVGMGGVRRSSDYLPPRNRAFVGAGGVRFCSSCTKRVQKAANYCMTCGVLL